MSVHPARCFANGLWNYFTQRKKYTVVCGKCRHTWSEKVSFVTDTASAVCPSCHEQNVWSHSLWNAAYDRDLAEVTASRRQG